MIYELQIYRCVPGRLTEKDAAVDGGKTAAGLIIIGTQGAVPPI